jgi:mono/diheme cytochrome c family protein/glucose/arabinose dehydrogenase
MTLYRIRIILILLAVAVATARGQQAWPPALQTVSNDSPVLSPEAEMKTFVMPPGYRVELVASEPMVQEPVLIDWDPDGRMWVIEEIGYMSDMPATDEHEPIGRVSVLEDSNADGKMDKKTVFLDKLVLPRALKVLDRGVLIAEPPHLWLARDTNGDLRADTREIVVDNYGTAMANVEHNANSLLWALDNYMYTSEHNRYLRLKDGKFEDLPTLSRGQWGATMDDAGRIYRNTNEAALFVDLLPARYFMRNPSLLRTRGSYESLNTDDVNTVWPLRPTPGVNRGYQDGVLRPDGTLAKFTSVSAPTVYRGDRLPNELYGNVFVVEPAANLVSRIILTDDGKGLRAKKAYEKGEFLASTDERFRPVNLSSAPDGTLYVVDMYHGIIQHKGYITEYLRDQILSRKLERPQGHGRIYRIVHETTRRGEAPALSKASPAQLVQTLNHPNGWWRDTAQRLLVERGDRGDRTIVPALRSLAEKSPDWRTRLHAMWTLDGLDRIEPATVVRGLDDTSRDVRVSALQLAERWFAPPNEAIHAAVLKRLDDNDWAVRRQFAATVGALPGGVSAREATLVTLFERFGDDPLTVDAALSGMSGNEAAVLDRLLQSPTSSAARDAAISTLAATIVRGGRDAQVQDLLQKIAETARPAWQRQALLRGAEAQLVGAPLPGAVAGRGAGAVAGRGAGARGANAPPSGTRGARDGPGGAPAFARPSAGTTTGAGRGRGNATASVSRAPAAFAALAAGTDDLSTRAKAVLARIEWPGKAPAADAPPAAAPLTAAEQQLFNAGQTIYAGLCIACHQEDGRGRENLAPGLVGSTLALTAPTVPIRILLQGKEGPAGLMPPLGATLTDEQIAGVLTYVRRQWGNRASAVDQDSVKATRAQTAGRARPWTSDELSKIGGGQ